MELKFIWIEEYKNIKGKGFNFNHSIDEEFQFLDNEIKIIPKLNTNPPFFFKDNISSVTAIVGKNGSGKTNLGEFINFNLAHVTNGSLSKYFDGYKGILIIDKFIFFQESIKINNLTDLEQLGYEIYDYENVPLDKNGGRKWAEMSKNKYIYYSSLFEFRYINMGRDNLTNISTSYLAFNDINKTTKHYNLSGDDFSRQERTDVLTAHYINEMIRESDFILHFKAKEYIGESPTNLKISIDLVEENRLLNSNYFYGSEKPNEIHENKLWGELWDLEKAIWDYGITELQNYKISQKDEDQHEYYLIPIENKKDIFRRLFLINLLKIIVKTGENKFELGFFREFIYDNKLTNDSKLKKILNSINTKLELFINECNWKEEKERVISHYPSNSRRKNYFELIRNANLDVTDINKKKSFLDLLNLCKLATQNRLFFHYQFSHNYSSGQQNLLNFYSRFFWAKNEILEDEKDSRFGIFKERIVIFIDEGEIALHPEWQRLFFYKATKFLSELFEDRQIQLILTTHSPFVLSDIPKNNVLFLDRDENGHLLISDFERDNTFGANIYSLLSDSFFMENTIGEFSAQKMKGALEILKSNNKDYKKETIEELKYIIKSIGEPIIKEQFEYLYHKKFGNDEVEMLKEIIKDLKDQIRKKENDSDNQ